MCVLSIKVPIRKKSGNLSNAPRILMLEMVFAFLLSICDYLIHSLLQE